MNPLSINPYVLIGSAAILIATGFGAAWQTQEWRFNSKISEIHATASEEKATQAAAAVADLAQASKKINDAASGAKVDLSNVMNKLSVIDQRYKNAKPAPLPADCKPDSVRVRRLSDAADATDEAIAGPKPSR